MKKSQYIASAVLTLLCASLSVVSAQAERVHHGDILDVDVVGGFEYDWRGGITPEGFLDGPEVYSEPINALCRTESEIAGDIAKLLGKTLRDPKVNVRIVDRSNRALVLLDGAVKTPARFQVKRTVRLRELIVRAGGIVDGASGDVTLFRPRSAGCEPDTGLLASTTPVDGASGNQPQSVNIKLSDLLSGKPSADPVIRNGDIITVNKALPIYIIGAVANPRPIFSREKTTVSRLIATAGGLSRDADGRKAVIYRRSGTQVDRIEIDLARIKNGDSTDEVLLPFDILEVEGTASSGRKLPPITALDTNFTRSNPVPPLRVIE